jgi:hypothetical protein
MRCQAEDGCSERAEYIRQKPSEPGGPVKGFTMRLLCARHARCSSDNGQILTSNRVQPAKEIETRPELNDAERAQIMCSAYHEAGHVVASWDADFPVHSSTVEPGDEAAGNITLGCTDTVNEECLVNEADPLQERRDMQNLLTQLVAGEIAEALWTHLPVQTWEEEYHLARDFAAQRNLSLTEAEESARRLLHRRWPWVVTVAEALFRERTLDETRLLEIRAKCLEERKT